MAFLCEARLRQNWPATPSRSQIASVTDSIGVRSGNSVLIWKVRVRPWRTRAAAGACVMSLPSSRMRPESGLSCPVIRLISVVLPAPFGPISAWRAPRGSASETSRATCSEPKLFCSASVRSTIWSPAISRACPQAATGRRECRSA